MMIRPALCGLTACCCLALGQPTAAQKSTDDQILEAVQPLSRGSRPDATVMGYRDGQTLEVIRPGTNEFICLADRPDDDRFRVSCYHRSLDPFMARGRVLLAEGKRGRERQRIRNREIEEGTIPMPDRALLISLFGIGELDPQTGRPDSVSTLRVIYMPYATAEETGLDARPSRTSPYLMDEGTPRAHVMIPGERRAFEPSRRRRGRRGEKNLGGIPFNNPPGASHSGE